MTLWEYLWGLLRRIARKPKGRIRLDEEVPLQLSGGLGNVGTQENSGLQEGVGPSQSGPSEEALQIFSKDSCSQGSQPVSSSLLLYKGTIATYDITLLSNVDSEINPQ